MRAVLFLIELRRLDKDVVSEAAAAPQKIRHIFHGQRRARTDQNASDERRLWSQSKHE
jgi:hypothetical protein